MIPMDANDLLAVSPKLLAQAILHRRERLAEIIPEDLDQRKEELLNAEPKAKSAREERDKINAKVDLSLKLYNWLYQLYSLFLLYTSE